MRTIFTLSIQIDASVIGFKNADPTINYFSNLSKLIVALKEALVLQGWKDHKINYTAVYRSISEFRPFVCTLKMKGIKYIKIHIEKHTINPEKSKLGVEEYPA